MTNEDLMERIQRYMKDEFSEYAILLHGAWGCGKTFFCNQLIEQGNKIDRDVWYISVFGVKEKKELDEKLFAAAHPILSGKAGKGMMGIGYSLFRTACQYHCGFDANDIAENLVKVFRETDSKVQCCLLIIDDLERAKMPIAELFGYFSSFLYDGTRMVFVSNEREISENQVKDYNLYKEKIIGESYEIIPEYETFIESLWDKHGLPQNKEFIRFTCDTCSNIGNKNLRLVRQILYQWHVLYNGLRPIYKEKTEVIFDFFQVYVILKMQYKMNPGSFNSTEETDELEKRIYFREKCHKAWMAFKSHGMTLKDYEFKLKNKMSELKKSLSMDLIIYPLLFENSWYELLVSGKDIDAGWVNDLLMSLYEKKKEQKDLRKKMNSSLETMQKIVFSTQDDELNIQEPFENLCRDFQEGKYISFGECLRFIQIYLKLLRDEVLPKDIYSTRSMEHILTEYITEYGTKVHFDGESVPDGGHIPQMQGENGLQDNINQLYELAKNNHIKDSEQLFHDKKRFFDLIQNVGNALNRYLDIPIMTKVDIDELFDWMESEDNKEIHAQLLHFLQYRYGFEIDNMGLSRMGYADYEAVRKLRNKYEDRYQAIRYNYTLEVRRYKDLMMKYDKLLEYMDDEHKKIETNTIHE